MNTLHVRSIPSELYQRIQQLAHSQNRSLSAQVITLLNQAVEIEERRSQQLEVLKAIAQRTFEPAADAPSPIEFLSEDRQR